MGIPNIPCKSKSSGRLSSPPPPPTTNTHVGSHSPLRTLTEPLRKSMNKSKQDDILISLFPLRPPSVVPVTPPRRPVQGRPATKGSVDIPCIGCTRIGTRKSFPLHYFPVLTLSCSCTSPDYDGPQRDAYKRHYSGDGAPRSPVLQGICQCFGHVEPTAAVFLNGPY